ncbi:MAG: AAA family ATPase, partial [Bacteroidetes bacterium]
NPDKIDTKTLGTFTQYPLKLAWAITIHKSQGKTFDKVIIDMGKGAFEFGQTYVALSRCRTLEGIVLKQPLRGSDIKTDERVVEFYERFF